MWIGARLRARLAEARFRTVFFAAVTLVGVYLALKGFAG